jgi:hypothetical protein
MKHSSVAASASRALTIIRVPLSACAIIGICDPTERPFDHTAPLRVLRAAGFLPGAPLGGWPLGEQTGKAPAPPKDTGRKDCAKVRHFAHRLTR